MTFTLKKLIIFALFISAIVPVGAFAADDFSSPACKGYEDGAIAPNDDSIQDWCEELEENPSNGTLSTLVSKMRPIVERSRQICETYRTKSMDIGGINDRCNQMFAEQDDFEADPDSRDRYIKNSALNALEAAEDIEEDPAVQATLRQDSKDFLAAGSDNRKAGNPEGEQCSVWTGAGLVACLKVALSWGVSIFLWCLSWILFVAGKIFNLAIELSISKFHFLANHEAVTTIWSLGRDLANIFFIFILLYIAIKTIVKGTGIGTQKLVIELIITALLINFSIIIPKVIIDVGNSMAIVFYEQMGSHEGDEAPDIAGVLVKGLSPQKFFQGDLEKVATPDGTKPGEAPTATVTGLSMSTIVIKGLGTGFLIGILSYALLIAAFMFLVRSITLVFLIATSSLAFFSRIIPPEMKLNQWDKWFSALMKEVFFAPYFLFVFYLVLKMADMDMPTFASAPADAGTSAVGFLATPVGAAPAAGGGADWAMQMVWYIFICGLAIGCLKIARTAGTLTANVAQKLGANAADKWMTGKAKSLSRGAAAATGRGTIGRAANKLANLESMKNFQAKNPYLGGALRGSVSAVAASKFGGTQNYDANRKAKAEELKKRMEGMNNEQKAQYLSNLRSGKISDALGMNDRDILYQHGLSDEERSKIEGAANTPSMLSSKPEIAATLQSQRTGLSGEQKVKTYAQRIKGAKSGTDKIDLLKELTDPKERKDVLKELDEATLAKIKNSDKFSALDTAAQANVNERIGDMDVDASEKFEKAEKAEKAKLEIKERGATIQQINDEVIAGTSTTLVNESAKLSKNDISNLNEQSLDLIANRSDILNKMKPEALIALYKNPKLSDHDALLGKFEAIANNQIPGITPSNSIKIINKGPAILIT